MTFTHFREALALGDIQLKVMAGGGGDLMIKGKFWNKRPKRYRVNKENLKEVEGGTVMGSKMLRGKTITGENERNL